MEIMIQLWREGMATQTNRKPKQIEEIIRRFIKNFINNLKYINIFII